MKKLLFILLFLVIGIVLFVQLILHAGVTDIVEKLAAFSVWAFVVFLIVSFLNFVLYILRWDAVLRAHAYMLSFWKLYMYRMIAYTVSYFVPVPQVGGEPIRVYYLAQERVPVREGTATVVIDKFLEMATTIVFILIGVGVFLAEGANLSGELWLGALSFVLAFVTCALFVYLTITGKGFFTTVLRKIGVYRLPIFRSYEERIFLMEEKVHQFFVYRKGTLLWTIFLSLVTYLIIVFEYWFLLLAMGYPVSFGVAFVLSTIPSIAYFVPVPGAVGVLEGVQVLTFTLMGVDPALGLIMVLIIRARDLVFLGSGFIFAFMQGFGTLWRQVAGMWRK